MASHKRHRELIIHGWIIGSLNAALIVFVAAMLTQPWWAPFDKILAVAVVPETVVAGEPVQMTWKLRVTNRYPTMFRFRWLNQDTGVVWGYRERHGGSTGQTGVFELNQTHEAPPTEGRWCFRGDVDVIYNVLLTRTQNYPPVCVNVIKGN